jgi:hypothetical protein
MSKEQIEEQTLMDPTGADREDFDNAMRGLLARTVKRCLRGSIRPLIIIATRQAEPDGVLVAFRDTGPPLAPANLERFLETFYTESATSGSASREPAAAQVAAEHPLSAV